MRKSLYAITILLVGIALGAQYNENTIADIIADIHESNISEDQNVTLEGQVTEILGGGQYDFSDGTGTVALVAKEIPSIAFRLNKKLAVRGKVEYVKGVLKIAVDNVTPAAPLPLSIGEILANPVENQHVKIEGQVTQILGFGRYAFSDGTGRIQLEADEIPSSAFPPSRKLVVIGEVEHEVGVLEIDVDWVAPAATLSLNGTSGRNTFAKVARPQI